MPSNDTASTFDLITQVFKSNHNEPLTPREIYEHIKARGCKLGGTQPWNTISGEISRRNTKAKDQRRPLPFTRIVDGRANKYCLSPSREGFGMTSAHSSIPPGPLARRLLDRVDALEASFTTNNNDHSSYPHSRSQHKPRNLKDPLRAFDDSAVDLDVHLTGGNGGGSDSHSALAALRAVPATAEAVRSRKRPALEVVGDAEGNCGMLYGIEEEKGRKRRKRHAGGSNTSVTKPKKGLRGTLTTSTNDKYSRNISTDSNSHAHQPYISHDQWDSQDEDDDWGRLSAHSHSSERENKPKICYRCYRAFESGMALEDHLWEHHESWVQTQRRLRLPRNEQIEVMRAAQALVYISGLAG